MVLIVEGRKLPNVNMLKDIDHRPIEKKGWKSPRITHGVSNAKGTPRLSTEKEGSQTNSRSLDMRRSIKKAKE